jgi:hypothetical protein
MACLEIIACGAISPKIKINEVAAILATRPEAMLPRYTDNTVFTSTFPRRRVASSWLPVWRIG